MSEPPKITELPSLERNDLLAAASAIDRTIDEVAPVLKRITDALVEAGYSRDEAIRLTAYIIAK